MVGGEPFHSQPSSVTGCRIVFVMAGSEHYVLRGRCNSSVLYLVLCAAREQEELPVKDTGKDTHLR